MRKIWLVLFLVPFFMSVSQQGILPIPKVSYISEDLIQKSMKKTFSSDYKIDHVPVASGIYIQNAVASHNAHMKHAIMNWLKKDLSKGASYNKELYYLLENLEQVNTVKQAIIVMTRAISAHKAMIQDNPSYKESDTWQERAYGMIVLQCSVVLTNMARTQFLMILDEVNNSLMYWKDQQQHPVKYFFYKSPIKWVKGKRQADEVASNIKKLEKLDYTIRVLLGKLIKHIYNFEVEGNLDTTYAWLDSLLSILSSVGLGQDIHDKKSRFNRVAEKIQFKLTVVNQYKNTIMSKIESAVKPGHIARNWLLYMIAAFGAYQAHNFYITKKDLINESLARSITEVQNLWGITTKPIQRVRDIILGRSIPQASQGESILQKNAEEISRILPGLEEKKEMLVTSLGEGPSAEEELEDLLTKSSGMFFGWNKEERDNILRDVKARKFSSLENTINETSRALNPLLKGKLELILFKLKYLNNALGITSDVVALLPPIASSAQITIDLLAHFVESNALNMTLLTLIPIFGVGVGANKLYHWMMERDYSSIRLSLLDINSLFIESTAPLSDYDYGKLIYLLQGLKVQSMRYLTNADMRADFLIDLAKLESNKFSVETKRSIVHNMFMKYPFLSLNAKSA